METMGATVKRDGETLEIDPRGVKDMPMPFGKINSLRASYYFTVPSLVALVKLLLACQVVVIWDRVRLICT